MQSLQGQSGRPHLDLTFCQGPSLDTLAQHRGYLGQVGKLLANAVLSNNLYKFGEKGLLNPGKLQPKTLTTFLEKPLESSHYLLVNPLAGLCGRAPEAHTLTFTRTHASPAAVQCRVPAALRTEPELLYLTHQSSVTSPAPLSITQCSGPPGLFLCCSLSSGTPFSSFHTRITLT